MHTFKRTQVRAPLARGIYSPRSLGPLKSGAALQRAHLCRISLSPTNQQTRSPMFKTLLVLLGCLLAWASSAAEIIQSDVCVYGGTAAGGAAAGGGGRAGGKAGRAGVWGPPGGGK